MAGHKRSKKMKHKLVRIAIGVPEAFIALSAIGGGIALLLGTYQDSVLREAGGGAQFPLEWLHNTPFSDYTIPALVLVIVVGGSSLIAAVTVFTGREVGVLGSIVAGLIMAGYIVGEVVMLKQGVSWIEGLYFGLGLLICGLATYLWMIEHRPHHLQIKHISHA
jgi:hypothetical protein